MLMQPGDTITPSSASAPEPPQEEQPVVASAADPAALQIEHSEPTAAPQPAIQQPQTADVPTAPSESSPPMPQVVAPPPPTPSPTVPTEAPQPQSPASMQQPSQLTPEPNEAAWAYAQESGDQMAPDGDIETISWTASEYMAHTKSGGWYGLLGLGALAMTALAYLITRDVVSTLVVVVTITIFGAYAGRKPRDLTYSVGDQGIQIGEKVYPYNMFRSFSIIDEGATESISLIPLKRLATPISIYFNPQDGERITELLSLFLPFEHKQMDPVDKLMRKVRF